MSEFTVSDDYLSVVSSYIILRTSIREMLIRLTSRFDAILSFSYGNDSIDDIIDYLQHRIVVENIRDLRSKCNALSDRLDLILRIDDLSDDHNIIIAKAREISHAIGNITAFIRNLTFGNTCNSSRRSSRRSVRSCSIGPIRTFAVNRSQYHTLVVEITNMCMILREISSYMLDVEILVEYDHRDRNSIISNIEALNTRLVASSVMIDKV